MISIIYSTMTGNTEEIAKLISDNLGVDNEIFEVTNVDTSKVQDSKCVIIGTPSYGSGEPQDEWMDFDFSILKDKPVAIFGLGDGSNYSDTFCGGMKFLYDKASEAGAKMLDIKTDPKGYEFDDSEALIDGGFIGLPIDCDNQNDMSEHRVKEWVKKLNF